MFKTLRAIVATATVGLALALGGVSVVAQESRTNDSTAPETTEPRRTDDSGAAQDTRTYDRTPAPSSETRRDDDRAFDYGWLGLAGLVGLLGLLPRDRANGITVRDGAGNVKNSRT
jgi:hypothetical protein